MPRVLFTAAARTDTEEAADWYASRAPQVVPRLREALRAVVQRIGDNPGHFPALSHGTRRALLRHFPYIVIFRETRAAVYVVAVFHTSRDPTRWVRRTS